MDRLIRRPGGSRRRRATTALGVVVALATASPGAGQDRDRLRDRCTGGGAPAGHCLDAALAVEAVTGGVGLALSGGNEFPGSASTLGRRFGTTPRVAASARFGLVDVGVPDIGSGAASAGDASSWVPSLQASLAVGLFDGFRPRPTVGGVLAVDVMATAGVAILPSGGGYDGAVGAFGYGVRVGVIRESFTLPGVTLSLLRRHGGSVEWKGVDGATEGAVALEGVTTTSVRATVGREFLALGLQAGLGWDRAASDGSFVPAGGSAPASPVSFDGFSADRVLFFGGVTATWLVTQFHGELGYASGYDARPDAGPDAYDPTAGSLLATLTFRILF